MADGLPKKGVVNVHGQRVVTNHPLRWTVYHVETGEPVEAWPVDARELVATGEYTFTAPAGVGSAPSGDEAQTAPEPDMPAPDVSDRADADVRRAKASEKEQLLDPTPRGRRQRGA